MGVELEGRRRVVSALRPDGRGATLRMLSRLGDVAESRMRYHAPVSSEPGGGDLHRRISKSAPRFRAGGAGGGGWWELVVGVRQGHPYPFYVHSGTGRYKRSGGGSDIYARRPPYVMRFHYQGRYFSLRSVKGQRPQPFVEEAYNDTKLYARARVARIGRELF